MSTNTQNQKSINTQQITDSPMEFLPGVDPAWAQEYLAISQKFQHFTSCFMLFNITPRLIKIIVKRPESIIRAFKNNWESLKPGEKVADTWEEEESFALEEWAKPQKNEWCVLDLEIAKEFYKAGLTPMEALIERYSNEEDGAENEPIGSPSPPLLEMTMLLMILALVTVWLVVFFNSLDAV